MPYNVFMGYQPPAAKKSIGETLAEAMTAYMQGRKVARDERKAAIAAKRQEGLDTATREKTRIDIEAAERKRKKEETDAAKEEVASAKIQKDYDINTQKGLSHDDALVASLKDNLLSYGDTKAYKSAAEGSKAYMDFITKQNPEAAAKLFNTVIPDQIEESVIGDRLVSSKKTPSSKTVTGMVNLPQTETQKIAASQRQQMIGISAENAATSRARLQMERDKANGKGVTSPEDIELGKKMQDDVKRFAAMAREKNPNANEQDVRREALSNAIYNNFNHFSPKAMKPYQEQLDKFNNEQNKLAELDAKNQRQKNMVVAADSAKQLIAMRKQKMDKEVKISAGELDDPKSVDSANDVADKFNERFSKQASAIDSFLGAVEEFKRAPRSGKNAALLQIVGMANALNNSGVVNEAEFRRILSSMDSVLGQKIESVKSLVDASVGADPDTVGVAFVESVGNILRTKVKEQQKYLDLSNAQIDNIGRVTQQSKDRLKNNMQNLITATYAQPFSVPGNNRQWYKSRFGSGTIYYRDEKTGKLVEVNK